MIKTTVNFDKHAFPAKIEKKLASGALKREDLIQISQWKQEVEKKGIDNLDKSWRTVKEKKEGGLGITHHFYQLMIMWLKESYLKKMRKTKLLS